MIRPKWDPFTPEGTREVTSKVLTGRNYRLFYESATRRTLIESYRELAAIAGKYPNDNDAWRKHIKELIDGKVQLEDRRMRQWLIGLTAKTAKNLDLGSNDYPSVFDDMIQDIEAMNSDDDWTQREMALLLWCGTATLTIRGSRKSKIGKSLERTLARALLTSIGLSEEKEDFRLNVSADSEVDREIDAEIRTPRGFLHMEIGLIGVGNSEVIADKVGRVGRNGIILMDKIPTDSAAYQTAENQGVRLVQLRNNHPVEEVRLHLKQLGISVQPNEISKHEVESRVLEMPLSFFSREN